MRLYTYWRSSAAYRVRIALNLKGLGAEQVPVDLRAALQRAPAYLELNPQGLVPALEDSGRVLAQSLAIIEYLEETAPEPPLLPRAAADRAEVRALALHVACDIHPLNNLRVLQYLKSPLGHAQAEIDAWVRHWIAAGFTALEQQARRNGDGRHLWGDAVTLADVLLVPQLYNARRFGLDLAPFPALAAVGAYLEALPAFAAAAPERQPDAAG